MMLRNFSEHDVREMYPPRVKGFMGTAQKFPPRTSAREFLSGQVREGKKAVQSGETVPARAGLVRTHGCR